MVSKALGRQKSCQKYSILISYLKKNFHDFSRTFSFFSFFQDFFRPGNLYFQFPGFKGFPGCVGTLTIGHIFSAHDESLKIVGVMSVR